MGRALLPLLILPLLLSACGGDDDNDLVLSLREDFQAMETWSGQAEITADYGQRVYAYSVSFTGSREEGTVLTITAPEEVAGINATARQGQTWLEYDGMRLETGPLDESGLSPMDALPALFREMAEGTVAETGTETDGEQALLRLTLRDPDSAAGQGRETVLWFDKARRTLTRAELRSDGAAVVRCVFPAFVYTIPQDN